VISFEEALETVLARPLNPGREDLELSEAVGRVLAEDVFSDIAMPPFDRSAVDGFAMQGEGEVLSLVEEIIAGPGTPPPLAPGAAAPIMTGAPVPEGADRIVMLEDTDVRGNTLMVRRPVPMGANICRRGEDLPEGGRVLAFGDPVTPAGAGVCAMAGKTRLRVYRRPAVALITTGDEVIEPFLVPGPGQIRNANAVLGSAVLSAAGFDSILAIHSGDSPGALREAADEAIRGADLVLAAGGVSLGSRDFVPGVMENAGFEFLFREVAQKPGKPLCFAVRKDKAFFGLPGNPVSVLVALEEYVIPFLRKSSGFSRFLKTTYRGVLTGGIRCRPGRSNILRAVCRPAPGGFLVSIPESHGSGDLMSAAGANCLVRLPADSEGAAAGDPVVFSFMSSARGEPVFS
jgi:molybdopterin molybdotransferase